MAKISFTSDPNAQGEFEPLPQGDFNFEIYAVDENTSKNGNPQVMLKMQVLDGPLEGKKATAFFTLTPKAAWRLREVADAVGVPVVEQGTTDEGHALFDLETEDFLGRLVTFKVRQEEYEGKRNNKFDKPRAYAPVAQQAAPVPRSGPVAAAPQAAPAARPAGYPGARPAAGATPPVRR